MIENIKIKGLLSFGGEGIDLDLKPLNVLVGPNGSGKSNFLKILAMIKQLPVGMPKPSVEMDGLRGWFWNGEHFEQGSITIVIRPPFFSRASHHLAVRPGFVGWDVYAESVSGISISGELEPAPYVDMAGPALAVVRAGVDGTDYLEYKIDTENSILSQIKSPPEYGRRNGFTFITGLQRAYSQFTLYREWQFGISNPLRSAQSADLKSDVLSESCDNLASVLSNINITERVALKENLAEIYNGAEELGFSVSGGSVHMFLSEDGVSVPATRLSDGTLRYLALLAILLNPKPPGLVAIEEPELGLHPDILPHIGKLIKEASKRMQLVVTTHSQILLDAFSEDPEDIVICQKRGNISEMKRLDREILADFLSEYTLGELWNMGHLGGNRW